MERQGMRGTGLAQDLAGRAVASWHGSRNAQRQRAGTDARHVTGAAAAVGQEVEDGAAVQSIKLKMFRYNVSALKAVMLKN
jgi:hypothetical protein